MDKILKAKMWAYGIVPQVAFDYFILFLKTKKKLYFFYLNISNNVAVT